MKLKGKQYNQRFWRKILTRVAKTRQKLTIGGQERQVQLDRWLWHMATIRASDQGVTPGEWLRLRWNHIESNYPSQDKETLTERVRFAIVTGLVDPEFLTACGYE